jgi:hypothetical protein
MENPPVISLSGFSRYPGVDPVTWDRFTTWVEEGYPPLMMRWPARNGIDVYQAVRETPLFPLICVINHHASLTSLQEAAKRPEMMAIYQDMAEWGKRNVPDGWGAANYALKRGFRRDASLPGDRPDTRVAGAQFLHIEAIDFSPEDRDKYHRWIEDYGASIIPLFFKPGMLGYDYYQYLGSQARHFNLRPVDWPAYLTLMYFENAESFAIFEQSPERVTFNKTLRNIFPLRLNYRWYVQYRLDKSVRK